MDPYFTLNDTFTTLPSFMPVDTLFILYVCDVFFSSLRGSFVIEVLQRYLTSPLNTLVSFRYFRNFFGSGVTWSYSSFRFTFRTESRPQVSLPNLEKYGDEEFLS